MVSFPEWRPRGISIVLSLSLFVSPQNRHLIWLLHGSLLSISLGFPASASQGAKSFLISVWLWAFTTYSMSVFACTVCSCAFCKLVFACLGAGVCLTVRTIPLGRRRPHHGTDESHAIAPKIDRAISHPCWDTHTYTHTHMKHALFSPPKHAVAFNI